MTRFIRSVFALLALFILSACGSVAQPRVEDALNAAPVKGKENFYERQMINQIEYITDQPGSLYFVYFLAADGTVPLQLACMGRPTSSTESLEPNDASYVYRGSGGYDIRPFFFPLGRNNDGTTIEAATTEQMGRDGTYGEPVHFRQCATPNNGYRDFPGGAGHLMPIVSNDPLVFNNGTQTINRELAAKQLLAEQALRNGKCVDGNLDVIECTRVIPTEEPLPTEIPTVDPYAQPTPAPITP